MRIVHMTAAALLGLAAASGLRLVYGAGEGEARAATFAVLPEAGPGAYRLAVDGRQGDCLLWPGRRIDDATRSLDVSDGCGRIGAALDGARLWIEGESVRPLAPMMTLTALR